MYASIAALVLLGSALAWTALNKSGIPPFSWYITLVLIGLAHIAFWIRPRRLEQAPLRPWLVWTVRGLFLYFWFQALPLPVSVLAVLSPTRAALTRALSPITGPVKYAPISIDPAAHVLWLLTITGCTAAFFLLREITFGFRKRLFLALLPLLMVAAIEAILGLLQIGGGAPEAVGSYNSRDHYCCILELTLPISISLGLAFFARRHEDSSTQAALQAIGCWFISLLLTLGILFSLSRAGWIDSIISLIVLTALVLLPGAAASKKRLGITGGLILAACLLFLLASPEAMLTRLVGTLTQDSEGRLDIWRELRPLIREFLWFGSGLMGFDPTFLRYQAFVNARRIDFAHNDFLQYFIELGIVGFLPLMVALGTIFWPIVKGSGQRASFGSRVDSESRLLLAGCVAGIAALLIHSLVDFNMYIPANMFAFAWILGFGSALAASGQGAGIEYGRQGPGNPPR